MGAEIKKISDFFSYEKTIISSDMQRQYEWDASTIDEFCISLKETSKIYYENPKMSEPLADWGTIIRYELEEKDLKKYDSRYFCYKADDGGQRLRTFTITFKVLYQIIINNDNLYKGEQIVETHILNKLNKVLGDIKDNFIEEINTDEFNDILNDKMSDTNNNLTIAFRVMEKRFINFLKEDINIIRRICDYICNVACMMCITYRATSETTRRHKYNLCNNLQKSQEPLHRAISTLSQLAANKGVYDFKIMYEDAFKEYKGKNNKWNKAAKKRLDAIFTVYTYMKLITYLDKTPTKQGSSINELAMELRTSGKYDKEYFLTFFEDFPLFYNLRTRKINNCLLKTKENCVLSYLLASMIDVLSSNTKPRFSASSYYFKVIKDCLVITDNNTICGIKSNINKKMLFSLLSYLSIYKVCVDSATNNGKTSDERGFFLPLLKDKDIFTNEEVFARHIEKARNTVEFNCLQSKSYGNFSDKGFGYKSKGVIFASAMAAGNDNLDSYELLYDIATKFFNYSYRYDIDHTLSYKKQNGKKDNRFCNLRLRDKNKNRSENNLKGDERYIDIDDYSFPKEYRGKNFTIKDLDIRDRYLNEKILRIISEIKKYCETAKIAA